MINSLKMKNYIFIFLLFDFIYNHDVPVVKVNYPNKRQWKMSKHDYLNIKLDIERDVFYFFIIRLKIKYYVHKLIGIKEGECNKL